MLMGSGRHFNSIRAPSSLISGGPPDGGRPIFFGTTNVMKPIVKLLFIVPILLWSSVAAADFRAGVEAYKRGDYATAYKEWLPLAEQGNARAQSMLGFMYDTGKGVPEDDAAAVKWYRKAAEQGNAGAQFFLGVIYVDGEGVPEDYVRAFAWFNLAAAQGTENAKNARGIIRQRMTAGQIAEAQELSASILQRIRK